LSVICQLDQLDALITDRDAPEPLVSAIRDTGVEVSLV
jgi:hypothetical protein